MTYTSNPTAENELTALINEDRYARTLANIARRAENLWADGYRSLKGTETEHFRHFTVLTPQGERYGVCLSDTPHCDVFGDSCTCPAWGKYHECKHHLAILWLAREEAEAAEFDRLMAEGETADGCDAFAEY